MTLSGPEALRSLEDALRDVRREEDDIAKRLGRSAELIAKIKATESELLRQLAKVRLAPDVQTELTGRLSKPPKPKRATSSRRIKERSEFGRSDAQRARPTIAGLAAERAELVTKAGRARGDAEIDRRARRGRSIEGPRICGASAPRPTTS
jgi:hypothetical protein